MIKYFIKRLILSKLNSIISSLDNDDFKKVSSTLSSICWKLREALSFFEDCLAKVSDD